MIEPLLVDPAIAQQYLDTEGFALDADPGVQATTWTIETADLVLDGATIDLLLGEACVGQQTSRFGPFLTGRCTTGIVVDSRTEPVTATLSLAVTMEMKRVEPLILAESGDFDGDGIDNATDNCVLVDNPDQADEDEDGIGDVCSVFSLFTGLPVRDSDGDDVEDLLDNCVYLRNGDCEMDPLLCDIDGDGTASPSELDLGSQVDSDVPSDGIGDACPEQTAVVNVDGSPDLFFELEVAGVMPGLGTVGFITVDFDNDRTIVPPVNCDWVLGECTLTPEEVAACFGATQFQALGGCLD